MHGFVPSGWWALAGSYCHIFSSAYPSDQPIAQHPQARIREAAFPVHRRNFVRQIRIVFVNNDLQALAKNVG